MRNGFVSKDLQTIKIWWYEQRIKQIKKSNLMWSPYKLIIVRWFSQWATSCPLYVSCYCSCVLLVWIINTREALLFSDLCEKPLFPGRVAVGRERDMERQRPKKKWIEAAPLWKLGSVPHYMSSPLCCLWHPRLEKYTIQKTREG